MKALLMLVVTMILTMNTFSQSTNVLAAEMMDDYRMMFHNPDDVLDLGTEKKESFYLEICATINSSGKLGKEFTGKRLEHKASSETSFSEIEDLRPESMKDAEFETYLGNFMCEGEYPLLYYSLKMGYCENTYGILTKLIELKDEGKISHALFEKVLTEGPVHPEREMYEEPRPSYNTLKLLRNLDKVEARSGHVKWCKFVKEAAYEALGMEQ